MPPTVLPGEWFALRLKIHSHARVVVQALAVGTSAAGDRVILVAKSKGVVYRARWSEPDQCWDWTHAIDSGDTADMIAIVREVLGQDATVAVMR